MKIKPRNAYKILGILRYVDTKPPTCVCLDNICGHLQGGALQRIYYENFSNQLTDAEY